MRASDKHTVVVWFHRWPMWPELLGSLRESAVEFNRARPEYEVVARDVDVARAAPGADAHTEMVAAGAPAGGGFDPGTARPEPDGRVRDSLPECLSRYPAVRAMLATAGVTLPADGRSDLITAATLAGEDA